jgi:DNA-directed RNA polymerase specialized sigma24 family protein
LKWYRTRRGDSKSGADRAVEELLSEHLDALFGTALHLCDGRLADAEDLLQDTALRAFDGFGSLREPSAGKAWLFTILMRTHLNRTRSGKRRSETLASDLDQGAFEAALAAWRPISGWWTASC